MNREIPKKEESLYYISTGENQVYYTLWKKPRTYFSDYDKDAFMGNLSIDYDTAIAKAKMKLGFVPEIIHEPINKPKERNHIDGSFIQFGKYAGLPIWFVYKYDPDYIGWVYENCKSQISLPNTNHIKENYKEFLNEYKETALREIEKRKQYKIERQNQIISEKQASQFVGTIGKRENFTVKINRIIPLEGYYGVSFLHIMKDPDGNELKWICSSQNNQLKEGETYQIKATVKGHNIYDSIIYGSVNQTKINRVVIMK